MNAAIEETSVGGFQAITLANDSIHATIVPSLGARVWNLVDRARGREWIWHRPGVAPVAMPTGAAYDDAWAGGWEELFPNDAPAHMDGRDLPDHGEWWTRAWDVTQRTEGRVAVLRLETELSIVRAHCTKEFRLEAGSAELEVAYRIASREAAPVHCLFKQHLAVRVSPACRLALPGGRLRAVDPAFGSWLRSDRIHAWPGPAADGAAADLRVMPAADRREREFAYAFDLPAPWCGVDDPEAGASLRMKFDAARLPYVWLFLTYGGWRDLYTAVLEPCTNMPKDLAEAARLGQSAVLIPGRDFSTTVSVTLSGLLETPTPAAPLTNPRAGRRSPA